MTTAGNSPLDQGLRPCPFCGGADVLLVLDAARWPVVQCQDCGANGPSITLSQHEAVAQWNTRAGEAAEREWCARVCESVASSLESAEEDALAMSIGAQSCADQIRAA